MRDFINLLEAPLADISVHGADLDNTGSFSKDDRAYMQKAIIKNIYKQRMKMIPFDVYIYILNDHSVADFGELYPEGEIAWDVISYEHRHVNTEDNRELNNIKEIIFKRIKNNPTAVHFIMGDNFSDENQIRPTPWIICHRMMHCMQERLNEIEKSGLFGICKTYTKLPVLAATMLSARNNKLQAGEFMAEFATQYFMTGKNAINEEAIKKFIIRVTDKDDQYDEADLFVAIDDCELTYENYQKELQKMVKEMQGSTFYI